MKTLTLRIMSLALALFVCFFTSLAHPETCPEGLLLWNRLGSDHEASHSEFGPNGTVVGSISYYGAMFAKGAQNPRGNGSGSNYVRFPADILNAEEGCVEFWYRVFEVPQPSSHAFHGMVNCGYIPNKDHNVGLAHDAYTHPPLLAGCVRFNGSHVDLWFSWAPDPGLYHLALVWNRDGIDGTDQYVRIYIDGTMVAFEDNNNGWGSYADDFLCVCRSNWDHQSGFEDSVYAVDNLKIWNYSKTDFSDRFVEGFAVSACVDIDPDVLNPRSAGRWVTAYIELPEGYDPADIDVSTVLLNETVPAEAEPTSVGDHDEDGIPDRTVKFSRPTVIGILPNGEHVEVCVSGEVAEHSFEGCDTIRVLMPKVKYPNGGEILEVRQQCIITWEHPAGYEAEWSSAYYTADDAESWNLIDDRIEGTSCTWIVPDVSSDRCRVLVEAHDAQGVMGYDISDQVFTVGAGAGLPREEATPTGFALRPANPNPFSQGTAVSFDLPDSRHVKLTIHDVRGRLVQELVDEARPAKSYSVQWDGKASFGVDVPAGIYFVHLEAGDYEATGKVVLVR